MSERPEKILWLNDARGVYIPRDFATSFNERSVRVSGVMEEDWETLEAGPDNPDYWDTWDEVLNNAVVTDDEAIKYHLQQDGDLWLVPEGMEWSEEADDYVWPDTTEVK